PALPRHVPAGAGRAGRRPHSHRERQRAGAVRAEVGDGRAAIPGVGRGARADGRTAAEAAGMTDPPEETDPRAWDEPGSVGGDCEPPRGPLLKAAGVGSTLAGAAAVLLAGAAAVLLAGAGWTNGFYPLTYAAAALGKVALVAGLLTWTVARHDLHAMSRGR